MLKTVGFPSTRTGDQTIVNGNLVIGTAGKGIDFSADPNPGGMTSELLDDYEEGTFTPVIQGDTTPGTGTYSVQSGSYTKIGNRVIFDIALSWSAHTGTGNMDVFGLPFTSNSTSEPKSIPSVFPISIALDPLSMMVAFVVSNSTKIALYQITVQTTSLALVPLDTAGTLRISGEYRV
jgi:hypothetical protein